MLGGNERTLGLLLAASGLGALIGSLYLASRRTVLGLGRVIAYATAALGLGMIAFSFSNSLLLSLAILPVVGGALVVEMASANTVLANHRRRRQTGTRDGPIRRGRDGHGPDRQLAGRHGGQLYRRSVDHGGGGKHFPRHGHRLLSASADAAAPVLARSTSKRGSCPRWPKECRPPRTWPQPARIAPARRSGYQFVNDVPVNVRQPPLDAVVIEGQPLVVDAEQMQNRGMEIVHRDGARGRPSRQNRRSMP